MPVVMKRLFLSFVLCAAARALLAQALENSTFENVIDTVIAHAAKTNCSAIDFNVTRYRRELVHPVSPGDSVKTTWVPWKKEYRGDEPDSLHCSFTNDSSVVITLDDTREIFRVRYGSLVSYPSKNKKETFRDSAGCTIHEVTTIARGVISHHDRFISDAAGHILQETYYSYGKLELIRYFEYFGDTAYRVKSFSPSPDSLHWYSHVKDSVIDYYKPAPYPDSLMPSEERYVSYRFDPAGHVVKETSLTTTFQPGTGKKNTPDTYVVEYIYSFDDKHRLTEITRITNGAEYDMKISYSMKSAKKN